MTRLAAILCAVCAACGTAGEPIEPGDCDPVGTTRPAEPAAHALAIGTGSGADFRPIGDAGSLELVLGSQGGWMVTPTLEVDLLAMASDRVCVALRVEADLGAGEAPLLDVLLGELGESGDRWYSDPLQVFLSYDLAALEGRSATLVATFRDDDLVATSQVSVLLTNDE